jgi:hypothetical protein
MKNLISIFLLLILNTTISFSQKILVYDNTQGYEFQMEIPDTIWIAVGTEQYKGDYSYLDWEEYAEDEDGNTYYSLSFKFFLDMPRIINVPYLYGFSVETEERKYERRIGLSYSTQVIDKSSIDFLVKLIKSDRIVAILLNEEGKIIKEDNFYTFGILETHRVDIENAKVKNLEGFSFR